MCAIHDYAGNVMKKNCFDQNKSIAQNILFYITPLQSEEIVPAFKRVISCIIKEKGIYNRIDNSKSIRSMLPDPESSLTLG